MIGIIDYELLMAKRGLPPPSLSAMKMAAYLKSTQSDYVVLLQTMENIEHYERVCFFSDWIIDKLPKEIFQFSNVELYGLYLNPIPKLAEHMIPDTTIYNDIIQEKIVNKTVSTSRALQFLDSIYYKCYDQEGKRLPLPPSAKRKRFYIYDNDFLSLSDCWQIIEEIVERNPSAIYMTRPIQCHTVKQFFTLREDYEKVSRNNKIFLDYFVPLHHLETYFGKYKLKLLGEITKTSDVCIYLGKNYGNDVYSETFYIRNIFYCLNLAYSYYSRNIPIKSDIYHHYDVTNPYEDVYNAIRLWINSEDYDMTLAQSFGTKKLKERMAELIEKNSAFEPFFNKTKNDLIQTRGIWRIP